MPFCMPMAMFLKLSISSILLYVIVLNAVGIQSRVHHRHRMERSPMINTLPPFQEVFEVENSTEDDKIGGGVVGLPKEAPYEPVEPLNIPPIATDGFLEGELGKGELTVADENGVLFKPKRPWMYYVKAGACIGGILLVIVMYYLADMYFDIWFAKTAFCRARKDEDDDDDDEEEEEADDDDYEGEDEEQAEAGNNDDVDNFYHYMPEILAESGDEDEGEENRGRG